MTSLRVRRNWDFITRRTPRPAETPPAAAQQPALKFDRPGHAPEPAQAPAPLNFTRPGTTAPAAPLRIGSTPTAAPATTSAPRATQPPTARLTTAPVLDTTAATLTTADPVVRLTRMQSAIGTLRIDGAADVGWQSTDGDAGVSSAGTTLRGGPVHANRPLIERTGQQQVLITLRHVHDLRRVAITPAADNITVATEGGKTVTVPGTAYIHRVGSTLEVRLEPDTTVADFGFPV